MKLKFGAITHIKKIAEQPTQKAPPQPKKTPQIINGMGGKRIILTNDPSPRNNKININSKSNE